MSTLFDNNLKIKDGIKVLWLHEGEKKRKKKKHSKPDKSCNCDEIFQDRKVNFEGTF